MKTSGARTGDPKSIIPSDKGYNGRHIRGSVERDEDTSRAHDSEGASFASRHPEGPGDGGRGEEWRAAFLPSYATLAVNLAHAGDPFLAASVVEAVAEATNGRAWFGHERDDDAHPSPGRYPMARRDRDAADCAGSEAA